ncbi:Histone deacetylase complex, catalytic component RPD3 [Ceraceosorus bombacis]|uniref:histone deacetylase n=1 Tax=Ceraceosorus bombacis TaxID=401625 RepID=A0A0P1BA66_9BASI|nr:Histone deacetylase complex, catalytic component RPD3 [Ceraceosorus bombacis]
MAQSTSPLPPSTHIRPETEGRESLVQYILSPSLLHSSNALPSNRGRSFLVHSLAYHLDLLDLPSVAELSRERSVSSADDVGGEGVGAQDEDEETNLARCLAGDLQAAAYMDDASSSNFDRTRARVLIPPRGKRRDLEIYHTNEYVDALLNGEPASHPRLGRHSSARGVNKRRKLNGREAADSVDDLCIAAADTFGLIDDSPPFPELAEYALALSSASTTAGYFLRDWLAKHGSSSDGGGSGKRDAPIIINWEGGRHHARKDRASGFCYVADAVSAILAMRKRVVDIKGAKLATREDAAGASASRVSPTPTPTLGFGARPEEIKRAFAQEKNSTTPMKPSKPSVTDVNTRRAHSSSRKIDATGPPTHADRILYLDLDLHWGDGVEEAFWNTAGVLTLSVHHWAPGFFPCGATGASRATSVSLDGKRHAKSGIEGGAPGALRASTGPRQAPVHALNLPLREGASDDTFKRVWKCIESVREAYQPRAVVVQAGVDGLSTDPHKVNNLSSSAYAWMFRRIKGWKLPMLVLGGGGYCHEDAARSWALITATLLGRHADGLDQETRADSVEEVDEIVQGLLGDHTPVPLHDRWPAYADRATLGVPAGGGRDVNDEEYVQKVESVFKHHAERLRHFETA